MMPGLNPFKLKAARKLLADKGIEVGSRVCVTWGYDRAYGSGERQHEGVVVELDDWIRVQGRSMLHLPISSLVTVTDLEILPSDASEKVIR